MIAHAWSIICSNVIVDSATNNMLLTTMEQIKFTHSVAQSDRLLLTELKGSIVSLWCRLDEDDPDIIDYRINIFGFGRSKIGRIDVHAEFRGVRHARGIAKFEILPVPQSGLDHYHFVIEMKTDRGWKKVADIPFLVEVVYQPQPTSA